MSSNPQKPYTKTRLTLMFAPFAVFFIGLAVMVHDLRHPQVDNDRCVVLATGTAVQQQKIQGRQLYRQSASALNDVALRCNRFGVALLNDAQMFQLTIARGQNAELSRKRYHFLPDRWSVNVFTGSSD